VLRELEDEIAAVDQFLPKQAKLEALMEEKQRME